MQTSAYRFRATFRARWPSYVALVLVIGLGGGVAMASVAGARRTQSSFPRYLASTNPSDMQQFVTYSGITPQPYSPSLLSAVSRLPFVVTGAAVLGFDPNIAYVQVEHPLPAPTLSAAAPPTIEGSTDGEFVSQDRLSVVRGRMFDPSSTDEVVMSSGAAQKLGIRLGSLLRVGFYSNAQVSSPGFVGYPSEPAFVTMTLRLVGIVESVDQVIESDDDALGNQQAVLTAAVTRRLATCCAAYSSVALKLAGGTRHVQSVRSEIQALDHAPRLPGAQTYAALLASTELSIRPEAVAYGVFGGLAALASLVINGLMVGRLVRKQASETNVVKALGAEPSVASLDMIGGLVVGILTGAGLAVAVAYVLSLMAPVGPVRSLLGGAHLDFDATVIGAGAGVLIVVLTTTAVAVAWPIAAHQAAEGDRLADRPGIFRTALVSVLPIHAIAGLRSYAKGQRTPMRPAVVGSVVAIVIVVASVTFGASLHSVVSRPPLYGWNWDYALLSGYAAQEDLPAPETAALFERDPLVGAWTGVNIASIRLDGRAVPALVMDPGSAVAPPVLSGHGLRSASQIVLGPATLAELHLRVGDTVKAKGVQLRITGTATMPTIGGNGVRSLGMGTGAIVARSLFTKAELNLQQNSIPGPNAVLVSLRRGVSRESGLQSIENIATTINKDDPESPAGGVVAALRPAQITDYQAVGSTPDILAAILAGAALAGLGLTLVATVRLRRREFAVLKAIGCTKRQIASLVAWQASIAALVGVAIGIPAGLALGRWLWTLFARSIYAVPEPTVPVLSVAVVGLGALAFANAIAAVPARLAARTSTALLLRTE